ncbi:spermine synthase [Haloprofundus marisrubri]|uniref:Polyamine aminopropyltransferase n=1 Tax=Haloprofundus marisrubri TaxID=1514971 RepID=A0A0W1R846_9EURY|nr:fused MFS/spermidine synthase [Haloprofundus marisrubri]KTG09425.1 spermine synthase [Haloprofundus marisrubri]
MSTSRSFDALRLTKPELAVFVSGVASMGLEILAGRMIAPQFGSSIYTWGGIIGVFLAALSYGYHRGGKLASQQATNDRMARVFLLTAAYVAGLIFLGDLLLRATSGFPLPSRFASLPAITLLFGPPTYLLGYISPYAAELSAKEGLGEASGHVYALGTIGSIVGAFATTYFLIPTLGVEQIALVFGVLSVVTALVLTRPGIGRDQAVASGFVLVLLVAAVGSGVAGISVEGRVVYETQTPYQELQVVDLGDTRTLYLDGQRHSAMDKSDPNRHVFDYTRYFHLPLLMTDDVDRVLFIGGGGFTGPKRFAEDYNVTVDVAEIDPEVIDVSKEYFRVEESENLNIYNTDGRQFLQETNRTYDLIVLDAYQKDKVPFELTTEEFMQLADSRLSEDGILFANVISAPTGPASKFYRAEYKTMSQVFPQVYSFPTAGGGVVQNIEVIATKNESVVTEQQLLARNERQNIGIDLDSEIRNYQRTTETGDVPVLRDDRAPVDSLLDPMVGQRYVIQQSNESGSSNETADSLVGPVGTGPSIIGMQSGQSPPLAAPARAS